MRTRITDRDTHSAIHNVFRRTVRVDAGKANRVVYAVYNVFVRSLICEDRRSAFRRTVLVDTVKANREVNAVKRRYLE